MGVYIRDMEKPKECEVCPFFILDGAITDDNEWISYSVCDLLGKTIGDADMLNDCPLIEIVECKDCKHWNEETHGCNRNPSVEAWWETDYCSYGERK